MSFIHSNPAYPSKKLVARQHAQLDAQSRARQVHKAAGSPTLTRTPFALSNEEFTFIASKDVSGHADTYLAVLAHAHEYEMHRRKVIGLGLMSREAEHAFTNKWTGDFRAEKLAEARVVYKAMALELVGEAA